MSCSSVCFPQLWCVIMSSFGYAAMRTAIFDFVFEDVAVQPLGFTTEPFQLVFFIRRFGPKDSNHSSGATIGFLGELAKSLFPRGYSIAESKIFFSRGRFSHCSAAFLLVYFVRHFGHWYKTFLCTITRMDPPGMECASPTLTGSKDFCKSRILFCPLNSSSDGKNHSAVKYFRHDAPPR